MLREYEPIDDSHDAQDTGIPYSSLEFFPHAVDLRMDHRNPAQLYEESCFAMIASEAKEGLLIGPHLVDKILSDAGPFAGSSKPDAVQLMDSGNGGLKIGAMWEFKSGKKIEIPKKIRGLTRMLDRLRGNPDFLGQQLRDAISDYFPSIPPKITIPPTGEVNLAVITAIPKKTTVQNQFAQVETRVRPRAQKTIEVPIFPSPDPITTLPAAV